MRHWATLTYAHLGRTHSEAIQQDLYVRWLLSYRKVKHRIVWYQWTHRELLDTRRKEACLTFSLAGMRSPGSFTFLHQSSGEHLALFIWIAINLFILMPFNFWFSLKKTLAYVYIHYFTSTTWVTSSPNVNKSRKKLYSRWLPGCCCPCGSPLGWGRGWGPRGRWLCVHSPLLASPAHPAASPMASQTRSPATQGGNF